MMNKMKSQKNRMKIVVAASVTDGYGGVVEELEGECIMKMAVENYIQTYTLP